MEDVPKELGKKKGLVDTHCHLNMPPLVKNVEEVIARAKESGVIKVIVVGINPKTNRKAIELHNKFPEFVSFSVGFHPHEIKNIKEEHYKELEEQLSSACAIGEIGLDWVKEHTPKKQQLEHFERLLDLAKKYQKPVILHFRGDENFWKEGINFLKGWQGLKLVFHCFTGGKEELRQILEKLDGFVSFSGIITFKNAEKIREALKFCPWDRFFLETDAPFLAPEPFRGKTNEPAYVIYTAQKASEVKKISLEELITITTQNAIKFFELKLNS